MVFKALVEAINKFQRNPDDSLAQNTVNTLSRELKKDLIHAYDLSLPLISKNVNLFFESKSFLDFLLKVNQLPTAIDYRNNVDLQFDDSLISSNKLELCNKQVELLTEQVNQYKEQKRLLYKQIEENNNDIKKYKDQVDNLKERFHALESEKERLSSDQRIQLELCNNDVKNYKDQIDQLREQVHTREIEKEKLLCDQKIQLEGYIQQNNFLTQQIDHYNKEREFCNQRLKDNDTELQLHKKELDELRQQLLPPEHNKENLPITIFNNLQSCIREKESLYQQMNQSQLHYELLNKQLKEENENIRKRYLALEDKNETLLNNE